MVTGGSGYLGSAISHALLARGDEVVSLDRRFPQNGLQVVHEQCDITDRDVAAAIFKKWRPDAVIHCAAVLSLEDSFRETRDYYGVNVGGTSSILDAAASCGTVEAFIYTSSASVYGDCLKEPVAEGCRGRVLSPYGITKSISEDIVGDYSDMYRFGSAALRCFNIVGIAGNMNDSVSDPGHLFPAIVRSLVDGVPTTVFGHNFPTPDGTAIRDYVDVNDVADAHLAALDRSMGGERLGAVNVGSGRGHSILEVLSCFEERSDREISRVFGEPRRGDSDYLVANVSKAREVLGWIPGRSGLAEIVDRVLEFSLMRFQHYCIVRSESDCESVPAGMISASVSTQGPTEGGINQIESSTCRVQRFVGERYDVS